MYRDKELVLLKSLRRNAREPLTKISRRTRIPVSTLFDRIRLYEKELISKYTSLLNFKSLGFDLKAYILIKGNNKKALKEFLMAHGRVNNLYRINNGFDFLVEAIFSDISDLDGFYLQLEEFDIADKVEFIVLEDLAREAFLARIH